MTHSQRHLVPGTWTLLHNVCGALKGISPESRFLSPAAAESSANHGQRTGVWPIQRNAVESSLWDWKVFLSLCQNFKTNTAFIGAFPLVLLHNPPLPTSESQDVGREIPESLRTKTDPRKRQDLLQAHNEVVATWGLNFRSLLSCIYSFIHARHKSTTFVSRALWLAVIVKKMNKIEFLKLSKT